ncbi:HAD family acid phosphatase [Cellulomonas sp. 73-92]|uniref:HAD family acid phosphatase n=1 Tax=Cellulomonas sp. 73-92 TaxID=1895740 RepID=UPI000A6CCFAD|nr:HAD family acid phosphatase [Cellulomonas sp. 73-92]
MNLRAHRWSRRSTIVAAIVAATVVGGGVAYAATAQPAIHTWTPKSADQVTNLDVLRQQIRNYYGDPLGTGTFAANGNYAKEATKVAHEGARWLKAKEPTGHQKKAIVLDVDDTTLTTWNYELVSNWAYNPTTNATYVNGQLFPATPGMVDMVTQAAHEGYAIFWITGRPVTQAAATLGNLGADGIGVDAGYPAPTTLPDGSSGLFTKPAVANYPDYLKAACANDPNGACTTIHYKSATRAYIESLGYDIVASFGDQYSDLTGGFADRTFKMPNPNYYLP